MTFIWEENGFCWFLLAQDTIGSHFLGIYDQPLEGIIYNLLLPFFVSIIPVKRKIIIIFMQSLLTSITMYLQIFAINFNRTTTRGFIDMLFWFYANVLNS